MKFFTAIVFVLSFCGTAYSDNRDKWPEGSAIHTGYLFGDQVAYFSKLLEKQEKRLVEALEASKADLGIKYAIEKTIDIWHDYASAECDAFGKLTQAGGSWQSTWSSKCSWRLYERRFKRVRDAANCVKRNNDSYNYFEAKCLQQMLPFNFKGQ